MVVASVINRLNTIKNAKILGCFIKSNQNGTSILMHHNKNDAKFLKQQNYSILVKRKKTNYLFRSIRKVFVRLALLIFNVVVAFLIKL